MRSGTTADAEIGASRRGGGSARLLCRAQVLALPE